MDIGDDIESKFDVDSIERHLDRYYDNIVVLGDPEKSLEPDTPFYDESSSLSDFNPEENGHADVLIFDLDDKGITNEELGELLDRGSDIMLSEEAYYHGFRFPPGYGHEDLEVFYLRTDRTAKPFYLVQSK